MNTPVSISVRGGKPFKNAPALTWRIFGTKGEIHLTSSALISLEFGNKFELYTYQEDAVEASDLRSPSKLASLLNQLIAKIERSNEDRSRRREARGISSLVR